MKPIDIGPSMLFGSAPNTTRKNTPSTAPAMTHHHHRDGLAPSLFFPIPSSIASLP
jgi:hypothetical protein